MEKFIAIEKTLKGKTVALREADLSDARAIIDFLTFISQETPFTYQYPGQKLNVENISARLAAEKNSSSSIRIIAVADSGVIGQIGFWRHNPEHPWLGHKGEFAMMILRDWWGSGLAKDLLTSMEGFARATGAKRIDATVNCENERGVKLYKRAGYAIEGTAREYKIVDGKPMDSYYIAKLI